jgi:hypothetical protein
MSSSQDQSAVGTGTSGAAAGTPPAPAGETSSASSASTASGQAPAGETATQYVPKHHVPRPAPDYDDSAGYAAARAGDPDGPSGAALGFTALAAVLMLLSGGANILEGIAAVIRGSFFVSLPHYTYNITANHWGWIHIAAGIVVFLAGVALFMDKTWARAVGVALASLSLLLNLVYIPYFPAWSLVVIAIDAFIIWALLTPRRRYA